MYGKHFTSTYSGSMYGAGVCVFAVWGYVIAHTKGGQVELNPKALAGVLGCTPGEVEAAIEYLCSPDPQSRNKEHEGRRLLRVGEFAYDVPSYEHYHGIRDENDRREYMREYMQSYRSKKADAKGLRARKHASKHSKPPLAQTEAEEETDTEVTTTPLTPLAGGNGKAHLPVRYAEITQRLAAVMATVAEKGRLSMSLEGVRELQVEMVFAYWVAKLSHESAMLDLKRGHRIKTRLTENGGNVHELLYVVDGAKRDKHIMGQNQDGRKYDGIETIFRDRGQVERLAELGGYKPGAEHPLARKYRQLTEEP